MTYHDLALVAIGEIVLALTFVLGVFVGLSISQRKESQ